MDRVLVCSHGRQGVIGWLAQFGFWSYKHVHAHIAKRQSRWSTTNMLSTFVIVNSNFVHSCRCYFVRWGVRMWRGQPVGLMRSMHARVDDRFKLEIWTNAHRWSIATFGFDSKPRWWEQATWRSHGVSSGGFTNKIKIDPHVGCQMMGGYVVTVFLEWYWASRGTRVIHLYISW